ncbi:MAG: FKBP-type peptidyl-prolyl cis-trans isomerase [Gammaproteobacteria bacterium]|nr:FKBP-type peptidyl-prolyl cis-trans isomerase [Gammaproteobacteria bacterium]
MFAALSACQPATENGGAVSESEQSPSQEITAVGELQIIDLENGDGATAEAGKTVVVHYTGWLYDAAADDNKGEKFDSSVDRNQPFQFALGAGMVIRGWDEGFAGMQVGGERRLIIPPALAYGDRGVGPIPPDATLIFDVELLDVM